MAQDANFDSFYFVLILHLILGKVTKFLVENLSTSEVISQKPLGGVESTPPPSASKTSDHQCYDMQIKQRVHLPMKLCDQEGIWKTQLH